MPFPAPSRFAAALLLAGAATPVAAQTFPATDYDAWYVGIDLLAVFANDSDASGAASGTFAYENALNLGDLKIGYRPQALHSDRGAVRFELELATRGMPIDSLRSAGSTSDGRGDFAMAALMVNALYDLHTGTDVTPYLGIGLGVAGAAFTKTPGLGITDKESENAVAAAQVSIGVAYAPDWLAGASVSLGYNYFYAGGPEFEAGAGKVKLDDVAVSSVQLGIKYHF